MNRIFCSICKRSPDAAYESPCCGLIYCSSCIKGKRLPCEICKKTLTFEQFTINRALQSILDRNKNPNLVACPQNCGSLIEPNKASDHLDVCPKRLTRCRDCNAEIEQGNLQRHMDQDCPNSPNLIPCDFANYGCTTKLRRDQKEKHMSENMNVHVSLYLQHTQGQGTQIPSTPLLTSDRLIQPPSLYPSAQPAIQPPATLRHRAGVNEHAQAPSRPFQNIVDQSPLLSGIEQTLQDFGAALSGSLNKLQQSSNNPMINIALGSANQVFVAGVQSPMPMMVKILMAVVLMLVLRGPIMFLFRVLLLSFQCYASYQCMASTRLMESPATRSYMLGIYGTLVLYLMWLLL